MLEKIRVPQIGPGRPRTKPDSLAADKGYSNSPCREYLRRRSIPHSIPEKTDSQAARLRKGSRGGRPPGFDEERYPRHPRHRRPGIPHPQAARPKSPYTGLTPYQVLDVLQDLLRCWTGACTTCGRPLPSPRTRRRQPRT